MAELREQLGELGLREVSTYIQSGNVVFSVERRPSEAELAAAIAERFGVQTTVVLRSAAEIARVLAGNPFPAVASTSIHVGFMPSPPAPGHVAALEHERFLPDRFVLRAYAGWAASWAACAFLNAMSPLASWSNARWLSSFFDQRIRSARLRLSQEWLASTTQRRARQPGVRILSAISSPRARMCGVSW